LIYLDTSALVKLVFEEPESGALAQWMSSAAEPMATSQLSVVELIRTCGRRHDFAIDVARDLLEGMDQVPMTRSVIDRASTVMPRDLRNLDVIHLASAMHLREHLSAFVVYDEGLALGGRYNDLPVLAPGRG
jgi:predicted nucleic acid-binding protein